MLSRQHGMSENLGEQASVLSLRRVVRPCFVSVVTTLFIAFSWCYSDKYTRRNEKFLLHIHCREYSLGFTDVLNGADPNFDDTRFENPLAKIRSWTNSLLTKTPGPNYCNCLGSNSELPIFAVLDPDDSDFTYERLKLLRSLVDHGADIEARDRCGNTPLATAAIDCTPDAVQILLAAGADVNASNKVGETPLMIAAMNNSNAIATALLAYGAERGKRNSYGETALDLARRRKSNAVKALLSRPTGIGGM